MSKDSLQKYSENLQNKIINLPQQPGVYIMRDKDGTVIYVGKAINLKNRVRQYFTHDGQMPKVAAMVANIDDFEYIITDTELEALVLECNLIKRYKPRYNILLKDDKHFPYLRIDMREDYPRIEVVRKVVDDGAKYFGPFIAAHVLQDVLDHIYKIYPLRSCRKDMARMREKGERPCLNWQMGRCSAPCAGKISKEDYRAMVKEVMRIVSGPDGGLKREMEAMMREASDDLNFELAATLRDKIKLLDKVRERQRAGYPNLSDKDIFAVETGTETSIIQMFLIRDGKLSYAEKFHLDFDGESKEEIMRSFLEQYYADKGAIPPTIYTLPEPDDRRLLEKWLSSRKGSAVSIHEAQRGDARKLQDMARKNAQDALKLKEGAEKMRQKAASNLAEAIGLKVVPRRIECYDISNTQGTDNVASMVVFKDGRPDKKSYRHFRIKTVQGANDFASMNEVLTRRLIRGLDGDKGFDEMPDLIIVDGGKGQLSSAMDALASVGCEHLGLASLAKREEEVFVPFEEESILLPVGSPEFRLVTSIRDEAHRFAITYHRGLREKRIQKSELDDIPGIGPGRKKSLLVHFGSLKKLKQASVEDIADVRGISSALAQTIYDALHPAGQGSGEGQKPEPAAPAGTPVPEAPDDAPVAALP